MRFSAVPAIFLACLTVSGCASSTTPEGLVSGVVSKETTSSVSASPPPAAVPSAPVMAAVAPPAAVPHQEELAWAGQVPQPRAFEPVNRVVGAPVPAERPEALMAAPPSVAEPAFAPRTRSRIYAHRFGDAKPINFGRASPRKLAVHGVDVSRWQGDIDWATLRSQGANFAYIKATDGGDHLDPMFRKNWQRAKAAGMKRGAYHFFYWCRTAGEQADWFIRNVPRDPDALPPVIDVEWNGESSCKRRPSPERVVEKMQVFMDKLERHYGKRPIIYTAPDFYRDNLRGQFQNHPFWLRSVAAHPATVYPGRRWMLWQYSGSGLSQGVEGKIDLNVFHGSEAEWHEFASPREG